jgi:hypothetical protein
LKSGSPSPAISRALPSGDARRAGAIVARSLSAAAIATILGALVGCAPSVVTLNRLALLGTAPRTIFAPAITPKRGLLGGFALPAELENVEVTDPAIAIRDLVTQSLAQSFGLKVLEFEDLTPDLVLEIQTTGFTVAYSTAYSLAVDPATVFLTYDGTLKLKDTRTNELLAEGTCSSHPVSGLDSRELEQVAETLLHEVRETVEYCSAEYRHRSLGLY